MTVVSESPAKQQGIPPHAQKATFAAGCFWGVEHIYRRRFGNGKGLLDASVGYCGGKSKLPTYRQVCTGQTGRKFTGTSFPAICLPLHRRCSGYDG